MRHFWPAVLALVVVLVTGACNSAAPEGPIKSFTAERPKVTIGNRDKLTAVFEGGAGTIDNGIGEIQSGATVETPPLKANTTFTLTITAENGETASQSLEVQAIELAKITSFQPDKVILPGQSAMLTAVFSGGTGVVDGGIGPVVSGVAVSTGILPATKSYTLTVTNEAGDPATATTEVEAAVTPVITSFTAPGAAVSRFVPTDLTAVFTGGKGTVDQGVGAIKSGMPTKSGNVPPAGATFTLTVTNGLGETVKKTLAVTTKKELFITDNGADVLVFDIDATGDVAPKRVIITEPNSIVGILGVVIANDEVFIGNEGGTPSVAIYGIADGQAGDGAIPITTVARRRISGAATTLVAPGSGPNMISVGGGEIFVADKTSTIKVWNVSDTGNVAPKRTLGGGATGLNMALGTLVDNGELYVTNFANGGDQGSVTVYPLAATGNAAPSRTILTVNPTGATIAGNELFVMSKAGEVTVFNKSTGAQLRKIAGPATLMSELYQCAVADGELFCASYLADKVVIFPANADGNVAPKRILAGDKTYISSPACAFIF